MRAILLQAGTWIMRFMPLSVATVIAVVVGDLCWMALSDRRHALETNLQFTAPGRSDGERRKLARATFRNLAVCTLDFLRLPLLSRDELIALVDEQGSEHLHQALAAGRGALVVCAHLGNWELAGAFLAARGFPIHAYAEDQPNQGWLFEVYRRYRSSTGLTVIPLSHGAFAGSRVLKQGHVLGLLGDRAIGGRHHMVDFCAGRRPLAAGPAALANRTGSPILIAYLVRHPRGGRRYLSVIEPALELAESASDAAVTAAVAARLSHLVATYPDQWFVFQADWAAR